MPGLAGAVFSIFVAVLAATPSTRAHDVFTAYIQHRVAISVGARHLDVTVQLTFFEESTEHERGHIDTDRDGKLSRTETDAYLHKLESTLSKAVTLLRDGKPLGLIPLRPAELDFLGQDRVGRGHHRLTLYYFAPTPAGLTRGAEFIVEDRLWPGARALGSIQAEGTDGCRMEAISSGDPIHPPARGDEPRRFKARVISPPAAPPK